MDFYLSSKTKELAFKELLDYEEINYTNRNYIELSESEARKLIYILDNLVQKAELDKLLSRKGI